MENKPSLKSPLSHTGTVNQLPEEVKIIPIVYFKGFKKSTCQTMLLPS